MRVCASDSTKETGSTGHTDLLCQKNKVDYASCLIISKIALPGNLITYPSQAVTLCSATRPANSTAIVSNFGSYQSRHLPVRPNSYLYLQPSRRPLKLLEGADARKKCIPEFEGLDCV